jgi:uncharacterized phage-associated protein
MAICSVDLAKDIYFLCKYKYKHEVNNTKVQKLMYLFLGFALVNDVDLGDEEKEEDGFEVVIIDELPKAWPYGPVFPKVHKKYNEVIKVPEDYELATKDEKARKILEKTVEKWGWISAGKLSAWSHEKDSPWDVVVRQQGSNWNTPIRLEFIREYFETRLQNVI